MKFRLTTKALRDYDALPSPLQARVDKQLALLLQNLRHPSIQAKKYDEKKNIWQGRVNQAYRFYFHIEGDTYEIVSITAHPKWPKNPTGAGERKKTAPSFAYAAALKAASSSAMTALKDGRACTLAM